MLIEETEINENQFAQFKKETRGKVQCKRCKEFKTKNPKSKLGLCKECQSTLAKMPHATEVVVKNPFKGTLQRYDTPKPEIVNLPISMQEEYNKFKTEQDNKKLNKKIKTFPNKASHKKYYHSAPPR